MGAARGQSRGMWSRQFPSAVQLDRSKAKLLLPLPWLQFPPACLVEDEPPHDLVADPKGLTTVLQLMTGDEHRELTPRIENREAIQ